MSHLQPVANPSARAGAKATTILRRAAMHARRTLSELAGTAWRLSTHAAFTGSTWAKLQIYVTLRSRTVAAAGSASRPRSNLSVALAAHVYYPELADEVLACWRNMPDGTPLYVTTTLDRAEQVRMRLGDMSGVTLIATENRGRDIAPFIALMRSGRLDRYDVVLKLHTKRSPHLRYGNLVRRALYLALAGNRRDVGRILAFFADPAVGMIGWRPVFLTTARHWWNNRRRVEALAGGMGMAMPGAPGFFGGTMFWFRPEAIRGLVDLPLDRDHFEPESGQLDGTLHHALERCFALAANSAGYSVRDTFGRELAAAAK